MPTRLPINLLALKAPWRPTRRLGCLESNMECVARTHTSEEFYTCHEPVQYSRGARVDGYTAPKGCQRVTPSMWRVSKHRGAPSEFGVLNPFPPVVEPVRPGFHVA